MPPRAALLMLSCLLLVLPACASRPAVESAPAEPAEPQRQLNEGYALLHEVLEKNSRAGMAELVPFRSLSEGSAELLNEIGRQAGEAREELEAMEEESETFRLDPPNLPAVEQATRDAIERDVRSRILTGRADRFELHLLLAQMQATRYITHLARQLARRDEDRARSDWLDELAESFEQLHERVLKQIERPNEARP